MKSPHLAPWCLATLLALLLSAAATAQPDIDLDIGSGVDKTPLSESLPLYLVRLRNAPPVAGYTGGIEGLSATVSAARLASVLGSRLPSLRAGRRRQRFDARSEPVRRFARWLGQMQERVAADVGVPVRNVLHSYKYVSNGFAAMLSEAQVRQLRRHPAVASVKKSFTVHKLTSDSTTFLKLPESLWAATGGQGNAGTGVVVGIVDTGIWPEHPSFADNRTTAYPAPPSTWKGICQTTADFRACNRKLIGARYFVSGFRSSFGSEDLSYDWLSARDADGHGTWCAGAAAGNGAIPISIARSQTAGMASGVAPRAFIAAYKVFWSTVDGDVTATWADVEAAVNMAVADGVDVLSLSLGGLDPSSDYFDDTAYLYANAMGMTVVYAAGNAGAPPYSSTMYRTISNFSPFYLTVGASSISRRYSSSVTLGNGVTVDSSGFGSGSSSSRLTGAAIVESTAAAAATATYSQALYCYANSLNASKVAGRIVVCAYGGVSTSTKVSELYNKGVAAMLMTGVPEAAKPFAAYDSRMPMAYLDAAPASTVLGYIRANTAPTATLAQSFTVATDLAAPSVVYFSSAGPVTNPATTTTLPRARPTNDLLKPDIIGPGVSLWAAWRAYSPSSSTQQFAMISGTSMATPHLAGIAALLTQCFPTWSPAQIMSAIMTTGSVRNTMGGPISTSYSPTATPWDMGQGHVNSVALLDPGLTYSAGLPHYYNFLAGQDLARTKAMLGSTTTVVLKALPAFNLNRPQISISRLNRTAVVTQWVVSVYSQASTYTSTVVAPVGVSVVVKPATFTILPGKTQIFTVTFTVRTATRAFSYGSLTWTDQFGHAVRSVLAAQPMAL